MKFLLLFCLISTLWAQGEQVPTGQTDSEKAEFLKKYMTEEDRLRYEEKHRPKAPESASTAIHETLNDKEVIKTLEKELSGNDKFMQALKKLQEQGKMGVNSKGEKKEIDMAQMAQMIVATYGELPQEQVESHLKERMKLHPLGIYLVGSPKTVTFIAMMMRDAEALPAVIEFTKDRQKLIQYGLICLGSFVVTWLIGVYFRGKKMKLLPRIGTSLTISLGGWVFRISLFVFLFGDHFARASQIFKEVFFT